MRRALGSSRARPDFNGKYFQHPPSKLRANCGGCALGTPQPPTPTPRQDHAGRVLQEHWGQTSVGLVGGGDGKWEEPQRVLVWRNLCPTTQVTHGASFSSPWTRLAGTNCLLPARVRIHEVMSSLGFELLWECCCKPIGCY